MVLVAFFVLVDGLRLVAGQASNGVSDMKVPAMIAVVRYWAIGLSRGAVPGVMIDLGVLGLWYGLTVGMGIAGMTYLMRFRWLAHHLRATAERNCGG